MMKKFQLLCLLACFVQSEILYRNNPPSNIEQFAEDVTYFDLSENTKTTTNTYITSKGVFYDTTSSYPYLQSTETLPRKIKDSQSIVSDRSGCESLDSVSNQNTLVAFCLNKISDKKSTHSSSLLVAQNPNSDTTSKLIAFEFGDQDTNYFHSQKGSFSQYFDEQAPSRHFVIYSGLKSDKQSLKVGVIEILEDQVTVLGETQINFENPVTSDPVNLNVFGLGKGWMAVDLTTVSNGFKLALLNFDTQSKSWDKPLYIDRDYPEIAIFFKDLRLLNVSGNQGFIFLSYTTSPEPAEFWSIANCGM